MGERLHDLGLEAWKPFRRPLAGGKRCELVLGYLQKAWKVNSSEDSHSIRIDSAWGSDGKGMKERQLSKIVPVLWLGQLNW